MHADLHSQSIVHAEEEPLDEWKGSLAILAAGPAAGREAALLKLGDRLWTASGEVSLSFSPNLQTFGWKWVAGALKVCGPSPNHLIFVMYLS